MLSRTADNLYWLARYMERMENITRLIEVAFRMGSVTDGTDGTDIEWHSTIVAAGCEKSFYKAHPVATAPRVIQHLVFDRDNPSSILACLTRARSNCRAVRPDLTTDIWEAVNTTWLDLKGQIGEDDFDIRRFLDWIKDRAHLFDGCLASTMMRYDGYWFARLGTFVERADNTARILDVKYHVLLPASERVGGGLDYSQWMAILRAVSAARTYRQVYKRKLEPWLIAELLILRPEMPRSLLACFNEIVRYLDLLGREYGYSGEAQRLAGGLHARLLYSRIDDIFQSGLHEFLTDFINTNLKLGNEISRQYLN